MEKFFGFNIFVFDKHYSEISLPNYKFNFIKNTYYNKSIFLTYDSKHKKYDIIFDKIGKINQCVFLTSKMSQFFKYYNKNIEYMDISFPKNINIKYQSFDSFGKLRNLYYYYGTINKSLYNIQVTPLQILHNKYNNCLSFLSFPNETNEIDFIKPTIKFKSIDNKEKAFDILTHFINSINIEYDFENVNMNYNFLTYRYKDVEFKIEFNVQFNNTSFLNINTDNQIMANYYKIYTLFIYSKYYKDKPYISIRNMFVTKEYIINFIKDKIIKVLDSEKNKILNEYNSHKIHLDTIKKQYEENEAIKITYDNEKKM